MSLELLPAAARTPEPWHNGGGITREVAADRSLAGAGFRWRISIADVASDGPFSTFAGCARVITVLWGAGMELTVDGSPHVLDAPHQPFRFAGSADTRCRLLDGPVVDLNVIAASGQFAQVEIIRPGTAVEVAVPQTAVAVMLAGSAVVRAAGTTAALVPFDAVLARGEVSIGIIPEPGEATVFAVIRLAPPGRRG